LFSILERIDWNIKIAVNPKKKLFPTVFFSIPANNKVYIVKNVVLRWLLSACMGRLYLPQVHTQREPRERVKEGAEKVDSVGIFNSVALS
jgi:hypothetical protein